MISCAFRRFRHSVVMETITEELLARQTPEARAVIGILVARNVALEARIAELEAKLGKDPTNSSKPPSTQHPHAKPSRQSGKKARRKSGGQPGHVRHERALVPVERCAEVVACVPAECRRCGRELEGTAA